MYSQDSPVFAIKSSTRFLIQAGKSPGGGALLRFHRKVLQKVKNNMQ